MLQKNSSVALSVFEVDKEHHRLPDMGPTIVIFIACTVYTLEPDITRLGLDQKEWTVSSISRHEMHLHKFWLIEV